MDLTSVGAMYAVHTTEITPGERRRIREELVLTPPEFNGRKRRGAGGGKTKLYSYSSTGYLLTPRFYGFNMWGPASNDDRVDGTDMPHKRTIVFSGTLTDDPIFKPQQQAFEAIIRTFETTIHQSGILALPCGMGKTAVALAVAAHYKKKTLVLCDKESLLTQWSDRITQFIPAASIGRIQASIIDVDGHDIVLGTLQSFAVKTYDQRILDEFGLLVIDEVHHICANTFWNAACKLRARHILGLSATPTRGDGRTEFMHWLTGPIIFTARRHGVYVTVHQIVYRNVLPLSAETANPSELLSTLASDEKRTSFIVNVILDICDSDWRRNLLVLSDRISQLRKMHSMLSMMNANVSSGLFIGDTTADDKRATAENCQVVLATYALGNEGLDIPRLNTLVMATPRTNVEQAVGRILRGGGGQEFQQQHNSNNIPPMVIDITDPMSMFQKQWYRRCRWYKSQDPYITIVRNSTMFGM